MEQVPKGPVVQNPNPTDPGPVVLSVHKHLFGLIVLYVQAGVGIVAALALIIFLVPTLVGKNHQSMMYGWISLGSILLFAIIALVLVVATIVYRRSQLVVTVTNITQVNQIGLFNRKISQLSLADVEDVSAVQKGVFASIFGFGTVFVETAGEQANFHFDFCPNPNAVAKEISVCEQAFNKQFGQPNGP
jgi:uncharacterized membrane protein YdbT with pleckstrin-like domain